MKSITRFLVLILALGLIVFGVVLNPGEHKRPDPSQFVEDQRQAENLAFTTFKPTDSQSVSQTPELKTSLVLTEVPTQTITLTPVVTSTTYNNKPTQAITLNPDYWKQWPVLPTNITVEMKEIYQAGLINGNNPHAFSVIGDCHSLPEVFMGVYDQNQAAVRQLDPALQKTVAHFKGSFDRYSPTVIDGATAGAILWHAWNENEEGYCFEGEIPIDCELRVHKPIIAFVHVGTHYETRNEDYMINIIEKLLSNGTIPVIVTKADNLEFDERINRQFARLAKQYQLPLWNFWASVQHLPNQGIDEKNPMSLSDEAYTIHRQDAIKVLDFVYRELNQ